jgi:hypothetical protein
VEKTGIRMGYKAMVQNLAVKLYEQVVVVVVVFYYYVIIYVSFFLTYFLPKLKHHFSTT